MPVERLKALRRTKKKSFNDYAKRRDAIKKVISNIDNSLDNEKNAVNKRINLCESELQEGLKKVSGVSLICSEMEFTKMTDPSQDPFLSTCRSKLDLERQRCQRRINELDAEIKSLESQIRSLGGTIYFWE